MAPVRAIIGGIKIHPLRLLREERGMTLAQVAKAMRTDVPDLSRLETGQLFATDAYLARYAKALRVPYRRTRMAYLLTCELAALRLLEWSHAEMRRLYGRKGA